MTKKKKKGGKKKKESKSCHKLFDAVVALLRAGNEWMLENFEH